MDYSKLSRAELIEALKSQQRLEEMVEARTAELQRVNQLLKEEIIDRKEAEQKLKKSREQIRQLAAHMQAKQERDNRRIARKIHDELGQNLIGLQMNLSWLLERLPKREEKLYQRVNRMLKLLDESISIAEKLTSKLRPRLLDDLGLKDAMEWQVQEFQSINNIKCVVSFDPDDIELDSQLSNTIFRIFQETLTNVHRHAQADLVKVLLRQQNGQVELQVQDNGRGITKEQIYAPDSFGIIGIYERVNSVAGKLDIQGIPDRGTTLRVTIPLSNHKRSPGANHD